LVELEESEITDDPTKSKVTKTVRHIRRRFKRKNIRVIEEYIDGGGSSKEHYEGEWAYNYSWGWYGNSPPEGDDINIPKVLVSYPKTQGQLLREAMTAFHNVNKTDNLLNLVESSQLKQGAAGVFETLRRLKEAARSRTLSRQSRNIRSAFGQSSNLYLFYSFGIAPLIADMKKINKGIKSLKHDLDEMIRLHDKPVRVSAQAKGDIDPNPLFVAPGYGADGTTGFWKYNVRAESAKLLVGLRGRRNVEYQSDAFKKLHYVISRYVATGPASFAWERIPFSFVVDWFVDLSSIVDALDNALTGFGRTIDDCWVSEKYSYELDHVHTEHTGGWQSTATGLVTFEQGLSYYHRSYLPPNITVGASNRFGKKQASLLAALLHQYVAKLR
jgi:hypothetical protein